MKLYPPWKWQCSSCDTPHGFEIECEEFESGHVELVDSRGEVILSEWSHQADDAGIMADQEMLKLIESLPAMIELLKMAIKSMDSERLAQILEEKGPDAIKWYKLAQKELHRMTGKYFN